MSEPAAILDSLNATERSVLESILKSGDLSILESLYDEDYEEIPVTIDEFISNPRYLGSVYDGGDLVYPYWRNFLHKFFHDNTDKAFEVCLAGDTVIPLLDGTKPTIKELAESENKERYLYSYDMNSNEYTVGKTSDIWSTGIKPVYRITLDNGESFKLTSNHRLLTRDKHWKSIDSGLSVGDSLMPFSTIIDEYGYERVLAREYNHKIVSIEYVGEEEVFDISVEGTHNFAIGAGIVAHNCLTGAIGVGKTTIAAIMMTYIIYKTLCLKDPRKFYRLTGNSPIVFVVMNLTLDLAYQGLYTLIVENIKSSPWFLERVDIRGKYDVIIEFKEGIQLIAGSNTNHVIGKNVIAACLDEVSFSKAPKGSKNSVMDMYRSIRRRMESRFMRSGNLPGMLGLISSKNDENSFLERYIESNRYNKKTIVIDKPVYEIKPASTYMGPRFDVAVGDKTKSSYIINTEEDRARAEKDMQSIIHVPIEYKKAFEDDINEALKEIAGISAVASSKLIPYPGRITSCIRTDKKSPLGVETIYLSLTSDDTIMDYLEDLGRLKVDLGKPRFGHVDIALRGDSLGLVLVHESGQTTIQRTTIDGRIQEYVEPVFDADILLRVRAETGSEIPLFKIREFILWMNRHIYNRKIQVMTFDGFQSADSMQLLNTSGIQSELLSVDRSAIPYLNLRSAILDKRVRFYDHPVLIRELSELEYDRVRGKVDHPEMTANNEPGSKDLSDALCGAVYNATKYYATKKGSTAFKQKDTLQSNMRALTLYNKTRTNKSTSEETDWLLL